MANNDTTSPRAVIWDLDGTLIESGDDHWTSWREAFAAEGIADVDEVMFGTWFGRRNEKILREHLGPDATDAEIARVGAIKEAHYRESLVRTGIRVLPGVEDWLNFLAGNGWLLGIGTSAPRQNLGIILDRTGLALHFDAVVAMEDVTRGKPEPDVFLLAAERLGVEPAQAIVVEDAAPGVLAGRRGGFRTLGVGRNHTILGATYSVASLEDLDDDAFDVLLAAPLPAPLPAPPAMPLPPPMEPEPHDR